MSMKIVSEIFMESIRLYFQMAPYLLLGLAFAGILNLFFTKEWVSKHIGKDNFLSILKAVLFGIPLPLCSCSVIPSAVFMAENGASLSAVTGFLIATPQTGVDSIMATYGLLGPVFALFRPLAAAFMGIAGGVIVSCFKGSFRSLVNEKKQEKSCCCCHKKGKGMPGILGKIKAVYEFAFVKTLDEISVHFLIGVILAGVISVFMPDSFVKGLHMNTGISAMVFMAALGIPLYICATASIPVGVAFILKGFSPGAVFVFLATGPATNAVSLAILTRILGRKITLVYLGSIFVLSIISGLALDSLFKGLGIDPLSYIRYVETCHHGESLGQWFFAAIFFVFLLFSFWRKFMKKPNNECS